MIIVTGCAGFIGSHLCEHLLEKKETILGIDNLNDYYDLSQKHSNLKILEKYKNFSFINEDIKTTKCIEKYKPSIVINLASMAGVRPSIDNPVKYADNNILGQINLLEQAKNVVDKFIYASSSSIYGSNKKVPFSEDDLVQNQISPYATSKLCLENYAKLYKNLFNLNVVGLRFFTVYGPRGRPDMAPLKFLNKIEKGEIIEKYGNNTSRDYTYITDIINGIVSVIYSNNNLNELYNLGNSYPITLDDFIKTCEKVVGKKASIKLLDNQIGDVKITYADISLAQKDLKYSPEVNLEEGLKNTYMWMKNKQN